MILRIYTPVSYVDFFKFNFDHSDCYDNAKEAHGFKRLSILGTV